MPNGTSIFAGGEGDNILKWLDEAAAASKGAGQGYKSFRAFKRAQGAAGEGMHWHHIVGPTPGNVSRFGAESIHNTSNVIALDADLHQRISSYYERVQPFTEGQKVRDWLSDKSYEEQRAFGLQILLEFGFVP